MKQSEVKIHCSLVTLLVKYPDFKQANVVEVTGSNRSVIIGIITKPRSFQFESGETECNNSDKNEKIVISSGNSKITYIPKINKLVPKKRLVIN
jgi:hypothetical protein